MWRVNVCCSFYLGTLSGFKFNIVSCITDRWCRVYCTMKHLILYFLLAEWNNLRFDAAQNQPNERKQHGLIKSALSKVLTPWGGDIKVVQPSWYKCPMLANQSAVWFPSLWMCLMTNFHGFLIRILQSSRTFSTEVVFYSMPARDLSWSWTAPLREWYKLPVDPQNIHTRKTFIPSSVVIS